MTISSIVPGIQLIQDPVQDPMYVKSKNRDTKEMYCDFVNQLP